ncbi:hypothetical protein PFICI_02803 [Pestalotiopsis fici W106-1]|uniref:Uncharacterized protein n=1 Tax=Pestalotiopsis fici (strain W106-1 / CGMCC3.15140) TaxID=1229662 RepID=W3XFB8_PESFW|nr:uncharacterized protein PFICI_02803 [Pestalotiopsis fici W106-1]ETS84778.1 hypothetical protein PFICI_02803 [Pestalotiopsis fici W106-1]
MSSQPPRGPRVRGGRPRGQPGPTPVVAPKAVPSTKRIVWTVAFAAVTIVGAIYGAGLKTQQEYKAEKQQIIESTTEDRISDLENRRALLMNSRMPLERKLTALQARMKAKEAEEQAKQAAAQVPGTNAK